MIKIMNKQRKSWNKQFMKSMYRIITGKDHGLPLWEFMEALGHKEVMRRLDEAIKKNK